VSVDLADGNSEFLRISVATENDLSAKDVSVDYAAAEERTRDHK